MSAPSLPVPVLDHPRWRVNIRPSHYQREVIESLGDCFNIVEQTKVRLRGWDFPHVSNRANERATGTNWVASWTQFMAHIEYWRFFQSAQFVYLAAIREAVAEDWREELIRAAQWHHGQPPEGSWDDVPGFFSILNFLYTMTEIFEFAARLSQRRLYSDSVVIDVSLIDIRQFVLLPDIDRGWHDYCAASESDLRKAWIVSSSELIANSAAHSLEATTWFFERMGWLKPNVDQLRKDQEKFLTGKY